MIIPDKTNTWFLSHIAKRWQKNKTGINDIVHSIKMLSFREGPSLNVGSAMSIAGFFLKQNTQSTGKAHNALPVPVLSLMATAICCNRLFCFC